MLRELFRQDLLCFLQGDALDGGVLLAEHITEVMHHKVFLGDAVAVVLVDEQAQGSNHHLYADGGLE